MGSLQVYNEVINFLTDVRWYEKLSVCNDIRKTIIV